MKDECSEKILLSMRFHVTINIMRKHFTISGFLDCKLILETFTQTVNFMVQLHKWYNYIKSKRALLFNKISSFLLINFVLL